MRGYACIALDNPKDGINIGAAMRAVHCYGAKLLVVSGERVKRLGNLPTDTFKAARHTPLLRVADVFDGLPHDCVPVAVDLIPGATPLAEYKHPERAFYIFGGEDNTLGERVTSRCRDVVYIPTRQCLNLAMTVNVVLYDRCMKRGEWPAQVDQSIAQSQCAVAA